MRRLAALWGALLGAALAAVLYAGWKVASFPFPPFDLFDWVSRRLPGPLLTGAIDAMVRLLRAVDLGRTDTAAKMVEQTMAVLLWIVLSAVAALLVQAATGGGRRAALVPGLLAGAVLGVGALAIRAGLGHPVGGAVLGSVFVVAACEVWGAALGRTLDLLHAPSVERLGRRRFLIRLGGATAAITVVGATVGALTGGGERPRGRRWSAGNRLPNASDPVAPAPGTRPEFTPLERHYRIDINTMAPKVDGETWRLSVRGLVERPQELTLAALRSLPPTHQFVTLSCISNPVGGDLIGTTRWTGVSLQELLPRLALLPSATHLEIRGADGFHEVVPLATIRSDPRVMLAYAWDGVPLTVGHGFPLRIYIPDLYGMKQPKWITSLEAVERPRDGYWVVRGWDRTARMRATSVIDSVAVEAATRGEDGRVLVPVGGFAHAGARGISKVEVQMDDGPWQEARLRHPISPTTWTIWRADLSFTPGAHRLTVRCVDGQGEAQSIDRRPPHPSGASGLHGKEGTLPA
ncbi:MAG TPA: molybdopterin-dependent oxidoreductase [Candidatus Polarisedimenticolaceae bacterium]|nr:molybdopterin-dependent oxidoreductase [Candidatus Polarisedimenticolaceae bacterium]